MTRRWHQRLSAMLIVFVLVFCSLDFTTLAELNEGEENRRLICGLDEHEHTEDCYRDVLVCGQEESEGETVRTFRSTFEVHRHSDACYDKKGKLACGMIEGLYYHTHNEYCRDASGKVVCGLETKKPHVHTGECYRQDRNLICKQEETEGHQHGASCYETRRELVCGLEEDPGHHHGAECYTQRKELTCGKEEDPGHHHTEECYHDWQELTCGLEENEEHTHTEECYTQHHDLVCGEEEREGHTHSEDCYTVYNDLTCTEKERDGHTHTDACYRTHDELICTKEEKAAHTHGEGCYETEQTLICEQPTTTHHHTAQCYNKDGFVTCGKLEIPTFTCTEDNWVEETVSEGHKHTDACYERQLVCGKEEHRHTDACYAEPEEEPKNDEPAEDNTASEEPAGEKTDNENPGIDDAGDEGTENENPEGETPQDGDSDSENPESQDPENEALDNENPDDVDPEDEDAENKEGEDGENKDPDNENPENENPEDEDAENKEDKENEDLDNEDPENIEAEGEGTEDENPDTEDPENEDAENEDGKEKEDAEGEEAEGDDAESEDTENSDASETTIPSADDAPFQVSVTFTPDAGIPEGTELVVTESEGRATDKKDATNLRKGNMKAAPGLRTAKAPATDGEPYLPILSMTTWNEGEEIPEIILFSRTIDISLVAEGEEIEPNPDARITVTVFFPDLEDGQDIEVRHITENGPEELESTNDAGTVTFTTSSFSQFTFTSRAKQVTSWMTETTDNTFYGKTTAQEIETAGITVEEAPEGLDVLEAYSVPQRSDLWMVMHYNQEPLPDKMESVTLYTVEDGKLGAIVKENLSASEMMRFNLNDLSSFAIVKDTGYRHLTIEVNPGEKAGNNGDEEPETTGEETSPVIILDGMMPKGAEAEVIDVTEGFADHEYAEEDPGETDGTESEAVEPDNEYEETAEESIQGKTTLAAFDITISNNEDEYQPDAEHPISVEIRDNRIITGANIELWHIKNNGTEERIEKFTIEEGRIEFEAYGFSVYTIVNVKEPFVASARIVKNLTELSENFINPNTGRPAPFYLSINLNNKTTYCTKEINSKDAFIESNSGYPIGNEWYFESTGSENQYRIYTYVNGNQMYIRNTSGNLIGLTESASNAVKFDINYEAETKFSFKTNGANKWFQHSGSGSGMRFYTDHDNAANSQISITYADSVSIPFDYYELDGKTYCIAYHEESVYGAGVMAEEKIANSQQRLAGLQVLVRPDVIYNTGELLIAQDTDLSDWTFHCQKANQYYITTEIGGETKYLTLSGNNLILADDPHPTESLITVTSENGKYKFSANGRALTLQGGKAENGFVSSTNGGDYSWLNLVQRTSILTDQDFVVYTAQKVDISDREMVPDGAQLVIFSRTWNDDAKRYEFYIVNSDGSLLRGYESGAVIQWVGSEVNTALWDFTEYLGSDGNPNYYYELQNSYSGQYIAPQVSNGQILSNQTIGINLIGRRYGYYYSKVIAWDEQHYRYVGLKTDHGHIVSCAQDDAEDFFYAVVIPTVTTDPTTVETVDHTQYGIKMRMINCDSRNAMLTYIGDDKYVEHTGVKNLLSTNLTNGYPTANLTGKSLADMYAGATEVNHLFIASTYYSGGYFTFDSSQNYASFWKKDGTYDSSNFTVYKELGTSDSKSSETMKHGIFLPYNQLTNEYSVKNPYNLYNIEGHVLPDSDPRKGERLICVGDDNSTDYYFAVEVEASFTQTANGLDNWGHDIIYEFTGDDDFWLYVDDELIIDLGGIHMALSGSVNYSTGEVIENGVKKTLYGIFKNNYESRHPNANEAEVTAYLEDIFHQNSDGQWIFKDYTSHTMKIFYMERGAGSSNLRMRFNLASVKPGTVLLSKELDGVEDEESFMADFPFQIWYKPEADNNGYAPEYSLATGDQYNIKVVYKDTNRPVTFVQHYTPENGVTYDNVFLLKPGEIAEFNMPSDAMSYKVQECHIDKNLYDSVTVNGVAATEKDIEGHEQSSRKDYEAEYAQISARPTVDYVNHVDQSKLKTLTITKKLYKEDGLTPILHEQDETSFSFRLYLGTENDSSIQTANMQKYHVKDDHGVYCYWDEAEQEFKPIGKTEYSELTSNEKIITTFTTSMYGSISRIPVDYTVEVRELLSGTQFMVEERDNEVPDGYSLKGFSVTEGTTPKPEVSTATEYTIKNDDYSVEVNNMKGWGLRLYKKWTDAAFMEERDPVYFAIYIESEEVLSSDPVAGTVRQMQTSDATLYWHFVTLANNTTFDNYVIREVILTGDFSVDAEGNVTGYDSITPIKPGEKNTVWGKELAADNRDTFDYTVTYRKGTLEDSEDNIREDVMINSRPGIKLQKMDMAGNPLPGAEFILTDGQGNTAGAASYTTDADGLITIAYLRQDEWYTLTEISAPAGYQAVAQGDTASYHATVQPLQIMLTKTEDEYVLNVRGGDTSNYHDDPANPDPNDIDVIKVLTIRNKKYTLHVRKVDERNNPIPDVHFALYREVKGANGWRMDYLPITGFEDLVTDADGVVPLLTNAFSTGDLLPGSYYLSEKTPMDNYRPLENAVLFTVTKAGAVVLGSPQQTGYQNPAGLQLTPHDEEGSTQMWYDLAITNFDAQTKDITVEKIVANGSSADTAGKSSFNFTATLYMPNGNTIWDYNSNGFSKGKISFKLSHDGTKVLTVPVGAVLSVTEAPNAWYDTKHQWIPATGDPGAETDGRTYSMTIPAQNGTIRFTNTRKKVTVKVTKTLNSDPLATGGTFHFTGVLTDYNNTDCTSDIAELDSFSLETQTGKSTSKSFQVPMGSTFTVTEASQDCYDTTYKIDNGSNSADPVTLTQVIGNHTITVTNKRKTKTVTVTKELQDATATEAVPFTFDVTLTGINDAVVKDYAIITSPETKKTNASGQISFTLSPTNPTNESDGIVSQQLVVPYGATIDVTETAYSGYVTTVDGVAGNSKTLTVTDDQTIAFVNSLAEGDVKLSVSKTVNDDNPGSTPYPFTLSWNGLTDGDRYEFTRYVKDNSGWTAATGEGATGNLEVTNGGISFSLAHNEKIEIDGIPAGTEVTIEETDSQGYIPSYSITNGNTGDGASATFTMSTDKEIAFTNSPRIVAPTGYTSRQIPFVLLMIFGIILIITCGGCRMKKRATEKNTEDRNERISCDDEKHIRWRNSVWVKKQDDPPERTQWQGTQAREGTNPGALPPYPRAELWAKGSPGGSDPGG